MTSTSWLSDSASSWTLAEDARLLEAMMEATRAMEGAAAEVIQRLEGLDAKMDRAELKMGESGIESMRIYWSELS